MSKKAQLTLFILIGVVLIFLVLFLNWVNSVITQSQFEKEADRIVADLLKSGALNYYVDICLDKISKEAIMLVGFQGGNIFNAQGGTAPINTRAWDTNCLPDTNFTNCKYSYGILRPNLGEPNYPLPPGYPGGVGIMEQVPKLNFSRPGRFGHLDYRELCDSDGANAPNATGNFSTLCLGAMYSNDTFSTQEQLEHFIAQELDACVNWTEFESSTGYNVSASSPQVIVRLGLTSTYVEAKYPLSIKVGGLEPVIRIVDFQTIIPVRLKQMTELISLMAQYDSYFLIYDIARHYSMFSSWDSLVNITVTRSPYKAFGIEDDLITITDYGSKLAGRPLIMNFLRENRIPALDWINELASFAASQFIKPQHVSTYDIVKMENETITINPQGYDPDEDNLTYHYRGWKETCDEYFDFDIGQVVPVDSLGCTPIKQDLNYPLIALGCQNCPWLWNSSELFTNTLQNASYTTSRDDIGPHNMTVYVCDEAGLCDWQLVRILVSDIPMLDLNGSNFYDDIPDDRASIEDAYILDASGTTSYFTQLNEYLFSDLTDDFSIFTTQPIISIPDQYNITSIIDQNFTRQKHSGISREHNITLTVSPSFPPPLLMPVDVYQCLPHRNPASPSWPFNDPNIDEFQADHTCCSAGNFSFKIINLTACSLGLLDNCRVVVQNLVIDYIHSFNVQPDDYNISVWNLDTNNVFTDYSVLHKEKNNFTLQIPASGAPATFPSRIFVAVQYNGTGSLPEWGSYMGTDTVCFESQDPVYGGGRTLNDWIYPYPATTEVSYFVDGNYYNDFGAVPFDDRNDIYEESYSRKCSGDRGNTCQGDIDLTRTRVTECADLDEENFQIRRCEGPYPDVIDQNDANPANACYAYTSNTYESLIGFNYDPDARYPSDNYGITDTRCAFERRCSTSTEYNVEDGPFVASGATCGNGVCNVPVGQQGGSMRNCDAQDLCVFRNSNNFNITDGLCRNRNSGAICFAEDLGTDPDVSSDACDICVSSDLHDLRKTSGAGQKLCCGDDLGEGNYPGYDMGSVKVGDINNPAGMYFQGTTIGDYGTENRDSSCSDYYEIPAVGGSGRYPIDNNCNGLKNCQETGCAGKRSYTGGICCITNQNCTGMVTRDFTCDAAGKNECDCATGISSFTEPYAHLDFNSLDYTLCLNMSETFGQKFINLTDTNTNGLLVTSSNCVENADFSYALLNASQMDITANQIKSGDWVIIYFESKDSIKSYDCILTIKNH